MSENPNTSSFLSEALEFTEKYSVSNVAIRQAKAIEDVIEQGDFPKRVGNFIVKDADTLVFSRRPPY